MYFLDYQPPHYTAQVWSLAAQCCAEIAEPVAWHEMPHHLQFKLTVFFTSYPHPPVLGQFNGCSEEDGANDENNAEEVKILKVCLFSFPWEQRHHLRSILQSANDKFRTTP